MALDNLDIVIEVIDSYTEELNHLLFKLGQVSIATEEVDNIDIDVDVHGNQQLNTLIAQLTTVGAAGTFADAGADVGVSRAVGAVGATAGGGTAEAADEVTDALTRSADALEDMSDSGGLFDLRMTDIHNALAKLIPLILVVIGALPAVIAGLIALGSAAVAAAGALAALGGFGALGFAMMRGETITEGFQEILSTIQQDFLEAFAPLAERLAPLFEDALEGLDRLFTEIAARGDILVGLTDAARDFGAFMLDFIPGTLAAMGRMADAFQPVFGMLADFIEEMNLLEGLSKFFADALPSLIAFGKSLVAITNTIVDMSIGFLQLTTVIFDALNAILFVASGFGMFRQELGAGIAALLTLISTIAIWNVLMKSETLATLVRLIPTTIAQTKAVLSQASAYLKGAFAAFTFANALRAVLIASGIGAILVGLGIIVEGVANQFIGAKGKIDAATDSLREFRSVADGFSEDSPFGADAPSVGFGRVGGGSGGQVNVTVEDGNRADAEKQAKNGIYRLQRPG